MLAQSLPKPFNCLPLNCVILKLSTRYMQRLGTKSESSAKLSPQRIQFIKLFTGADSRTGESYRREMEINPATEEAHRKRSTKRLKRQSQKQKGCTWYPGNGNHTWRGNRHQRLHGRRRPPHLSRSAKRRWWRPWVADPHGYLPGMRACFPSWASGTGWPTARHRQTIGGSVESDGCHPAWPRCYRQWPGFSQNIETNLAEVEGILKRFRPSTRWNRRTQPAGMSAPARTDGRRTGCGCDRG